MAPLVALAGFMGSGKTSVGAAVAAQLGWRFMDLDDEFVRTCGVSIAEFFSQEGERAFRALERDLLKAVVTTHRADEGLVLALGGGTLEDPEARRVLKGRAGLIWLDVDLDNAWSRCAETGRPLARDHTAFADLWRSRRATYEATADWILPVGDRTVQSLSQQISEMVRAAGGEWQKQWGRWLSSTERPSVVAGGSGALSNLRTLAATITGRGSRFFVITDRNVMPHWGEQVATLLGGPCAVAVLVLEPGERNKNLASLGHCWEWLAAQGARRDDVVVALGGGVVGDLAGFAAATYQRGVSLWQVATSLLAQVDSSVGGKTAIDLESGKNLVGAFYQPDMALIDPALLSTLPDEEYRGALGEVIKHALLTSDHAVEFLERETAAVLEREPEVLSALIRQSVFFKAGVVERDERESGLRSILNLGHTAAHALELVEGYGRLRHGEAVGLGLLVALVVSERLLGLDVRVRERTGALLSRFGLRTRLFLPSPESVWAAAGRDKKVRAQSMGFVGLRAIGEPEWGLNVPADVLAEALEVIRQ